MREILRLITFAVITFGITALALLFSNPEFAQGISQRLGLIDPLEEGASERLAESSTVIRVYRPHLGTWLGLQGFPSQASLRFPVPAAEGIIGGQLQLDLETNLIERGDGLVRILVNGRERDALVLASGLEHQRLTYDLLPADIAAGEIVVSLSGNGTTNQGQICPTNVTNLGAAVEVLASSGVLLELDQPRSDAATRVVLAPDPLSFDAAGLPAMAAWATQYLSRKGVAAELAPAELDQTLLLVASADAPITLSEAGRVTAAGIEGVDAIGLLRGAALPSSYGRAWPLPVEALTTDLLAHTFRGSSRWTLDYKLADLPEGRAPALLNLALRTSQLQGDNRWTLRVLLNGRLVHTATYPGASERLDAAIALPPEAQGFANQIVVTLVDNSPNDGICRAGPEAAAQLLPETGLDPASTPANDKQRLVTHLAAAEHIAVTAPPGASLGATSRAAGLLDLTLPLDRLPAFAAADGVTIQLIDTAQLTQGAAPTVPEGATAAYLVVPSRSADADGVAVLPYGTQAQPVALPAEATAGLLVSW